MTGRKNSFGGEMIDIRNLCTDIGFEHKDILLKGSVEPTVAGVGDKGKTFRNIRHEFKK
jgi:hypothetical protein